MKFFIVAALLAAVAAEPEAQLYQYGAYPGLPAYTGYSGFSGYTGYTGLNGWAQPYVYGSRLYKRDAEAQSGIVYKNGDFHTNVENLQKGVHTQYAAQTPVSQYYQPIPAQVYNVPRVYGQVPYVQTPYVHALYKREAEAEAEPQFFYRSNLYNAYPRVPVTYTAGNYYNAFNPLRRFYY